MSRSIHVTTRNFKGLSKKAIQDQTNDPDSDLTQYRKKYGLKKSILKGRKNKKKGK